MKWAILNLNLGQKAASILVASFCLFSVHFISSIFLPSQETPYLLLSMGAAVIIMTATPQRSVASYKAFFLGNMVSALVGVFIASFDLPMTLALPLGIGLAMSAMALLKCEHPPGGATALSAIMGGEKIQALGYAYCLMPVGLNLLIVGAIIFCYRQINKSYFAE